MRKLYREHIAIPEQGKITEKTIFGRMIFTIAVMVICLGAMSMTAYAYFTANITSDANIIKAAHFETAISIQTTGEGNETVDIKTTTSNYQTHKVRLEAGKTYQVTITPTTNSTAQTGFVIVSANGTDKVYHTQQLGVDEKEPEKVTPKITFQLMLTDATEVYFTAHWGTSSHYDAYKSKGNNNELYIVDSGELTMIINGYTTPNITTQSTLNNEDDNQEDTAGTTGQQSDDTASSQSDTTNTQLSTPTDTNTQSNTQTETSSNTGAAGDVQTEGEAQKEDEIQTEDGVQSEDATEPEGETPSQDEVTDGAAQEESAE